MPRLSGTPWHTEVIGDGERHYRTVCKFYNKVTEECTKLHGKCPGSSHCTHFRRMSDEEIKERDRELRAAGYTGKPRHEKHEEDFWFLHKNDETNKEPTVKPCEKDTKQHNFNIGDKVSNSQYGVGSVIEVKGNDIVIKFENNVVRTFVYPYCRKTLKHCQKK